MTGPRHDSDNGSHEEPLDDAFDASAVDVLADAVLMGDRGPGFDAALASCGHRLMQEFECAAAALMVALEPPAPAMPAALRERVAAALASTESVTVDDPVAPASSASVQMHHDAARHTASNEHAVDARSVATGGLGVIGAIGFVGWALAAASIALAIFAWWPGLDATVAPMAEALATPAALRARAGVVELDWTATDDPLVTGTVDGEVLWDPAAQEGCMVIRGLAANDPTELQYQLWIFDAERDDRYPVDGGVFDVTAGADEIIVPIAAKLPVRTATLFAVTVEPPGGVVVSDRRIALLAQR